MGTAPFATTVVIRKQSAAGRIAVNSSASVALSPALQFELWTLLSVS